MELQWIQDPESEVDEDDETDNNDEVDDHTSHSCDFPQYECSAGESNRYEQP